MWVMESLVQRNQAYLKARPNTPRLYQSGVVYKLPAQMDGEVPEVSLLKQFLSPSGLRDNRVLDVLDKIQAVLGGERFRDIGRIIENGGGDCDNVACWRAARGSGQAALAFFDPTGQKGYFGYGSANDTLHMYQGLNSSLVLFTNGTQRLDISGAGNVTIADPTSGYPLTVSANGTLAALFKNSNSGAVNAGIAFGSPGSTNLSAGVAGLAQSATTGALLLQYVTGGALTEGARIDTGGNLGIGVAPTYKVDAAGPDGNGYRYVAAGIGTLFGVSGVGVAGTVTNHNFAILTNSSTRMVFDTSGNVGVGGGSPTSLFDVNKAGQTIRARLRAAAGFASIFSICGNNTTAEVTSFDLQMDSTGSADIVQRNNARLSLYANATEWIRINTGGDISLQLGAGALRLNGHISRFESAEQSVPTTTFASNTLTHGGSRVPDVCRLVLRCKTAELGYSVGDEVDVTLHNHTMTDRAFNVWHSTTQTGYVWITGLNVAPSLSHKTTGTMTTVTAANWRVVVYNHWL
jgi:hypothetical protein